jgi:hypothetical protein
MKWRAIVGAVVLLAVTLLGIGLVHDWRLESDFPAIRAKSSEIQVKDLMGEPREVDRPCQAYDIRLTANCDHVFVYRSSLAPLRDKYWLVFFDGNNQATATSSEIEP